MRTVIAVAAALALAGCIDRPRPLIDSGPLPRFEDHAVARSWAGEPAAPDMSSHPDASRFGAALWQGARRGPNFAGHYTIVSRSCGRLCREFVIVDAATGRVYPGLRDTPPFEFRIDSRLIAFETPEAGGASAYYVWNVPRLELLPPDSFLGSAPPPERFRAVIDSVRWEERGSLQAAAPMVLRPGWDRLVISARDGTRRILRDEVNDSVVRLHLFRGWVAREGHFLVEIIGNGVPRWQAIDPGSGQVVELDTVAVPRRRLQVRPSG
jgi:hypothetical protein